MIQRLQEGVVHPPEHLLADVPELPALQLPPFKSYFETLDKQLLDILETEIQTKQHSHIVLVHTHHVDLVPHVVGSFHYVQILWGHVEFLSQTTYPVVYVVIVVLVNLRVNLLQCFLPPTRLRKIGRVALHEYMLLKLELVQVDRNHGVVLGKRIKRFSPPLVDILHHGFPD